MSDDRWRIVDQQWDGCFALITPEGRDIMILTKNGGIGQGVLEEIGIAIDEAFRRYTLRSEREEAMRKQLGENK